MVIKKKGIGFKENSLEKVNTSPEYKILDIYCTVIEFPPPELYKEISEDSDSISAYDHRNEHGIDQLHCFFEINDDLPQKYKSIFNEFSDSHSKMSRFENFKFATSNQAEILINKKINASRFEANAPLQEVCNAIQIIMLKYNFVGEFLLVDCKEKGYCISTFLPSDIEDKILEDLCSELNLDYSSTVIKGKFFTGGAKVKQNGN